MTIDNVLPARRPFRGGRTVACRGVVNVPRHVPCLSATLRGAKTPVMDALYSRLQLYRPRSAQVHDRVIILILVAGLPGIAEFISRCVVSQCRCFAELRRSSRYRLKTVPLYYRTARLFLISCFASLRGAL